MTCRLSRRVPPGQAPDHSPGQGDRYEHPLWPRAASPRTATGKLPQPTGQRRVEPECVEIGGERCGAGAEQSFIDVARVLDDRLALLGRAALRLRAAAARLLDIYDRIAFGMFHDDNDASAATALQRRRRTPEC